jgi:P-type Ca2+ transporter type 2C
MSVETADIVPGDIILLEAGDKVSADARLFEALNLEVDEAMLTGESLPVSKMVDPLEGDLQIADRKNLVYGGTIITEGRGKAVVYATGQKTQMGEIATLIQETEKATSPLQIQTLALGKDARFSGIWRRTWSFCSWALCAGLSCKSCSCSPSQP